MPFSGDELVHLEEMAMNNSLKMQESKCTATGCAPPAQEVQKSRLFAIR